MEGLRATGVQIQNRAKPPHCAKVNGCDLAR
jgi:hypothetical protein